MTIFSTKTTGLMKCVCVCERERVTQLCLTLYSPMNCSLQVPLSVGFFQQEHWNGWPFPLPGALPDPGIEPMSPASPALQADSLPLSCWASPMGSGEYQEKQGNKGLRKSRNELGILGHRAWTMHSLLSLEFSCLSCIISGK